jgi:hypothetical protein
VKYHYVRRNSQSKKKIIKRNRLPKFYAFMIKIIEQSFLTPFYDRNYNYGKIGEALKVDLLNHPEYIEQNATLAFQAALWKWMTPPEKHIPSPHDVFVGNWKPTKNDTLSKRVPGFGATINILYGDQVCGQGSDNESMNNIISHYLYYLDLLGVGREEAGPNEILSCAEQAAFKPSGSPSSSTT